MFEVLAGTVRQKEINGIEIGKKKSEHPFLQMIRSYYMGDLKDSTQKFLVLMNTFRKATGYEIYKNQ